MFQAHRVGWRFVRNVLLFFIRLHFYLFQAHRVGWRRKNKLFIPFPNKCSEPTAWDDDLKAYLITPPACERIRSKPTVWDGDLRGRLLPRRRGSARSEPTVWDGDASHISLASSSVRTLCLGSKPTAWDGDIHIALPLCEGLEPSSEPTVWDGDRAHLSGKPRKYSVSWF
jgi:hypothetical protein